MANRPIDSPETDTFRVLVVQHFEGVVVEDGDDGAGEVSEREIGGKNEDKYVRSSRVTMLSLGFRETSTLSVARQTA
jgi:hypothetical protein